MAKLKSYQRLFAVLLLTLSSASCVTSQRKPCSEGGQAARETVGTFRGTKKCYQKRDQSGNFVNDGKYFEWYPNDKISLVGEYLQGKKTGRWQEYNEKGEVISDKYFKDGKEVPAP